MEDIPVRADASPSSGKTSAAFRWRTRELFRYLLTTFQSMLPPDKAEQFGRLAEELGRSIEDNCQACRQCQLDEVATPRDPRRNRFLLRLVVGRVSHLFTGPTPAMPRSLIEGLDRYLKKAFGPIIYDELNAEADQILYNLKVDDDRQMWEAIRRNPPMRRFVDTIFIRVLFRFENFAAGKKTFSNILATTMHEASNFQFGEEHFFAVFEGLFGELWIELEQEEQRVRWDFLFGDGTSARLRAILKQGLQQWLKRKDVMGSGRLATGKAPVRKTRGA